MPAFRERTETALLRAAMGLPPGAQRLLGGRPVVIDGQRLAAETQLMLRLQQLADQPALAMSDDVAAERAALDLQGAMVGGQQPIGVVRELKVAGGAGPMLARLYVPVAALGPDPAATLLFIHGGGHALGSLDSHDAACRHLAEHSGVQVLSIDYRLAPEHPFPAAVEDCAAAVEWLAEHAAEVNADPDRLAVGGDSAGGNLAAVAAIHAAEKGIPLAFQLLIYPVTDFAHRARSRDLFDGGGYYLERPGMDRLHRWYLPDPGDDADPRASVLLREGLPDGLAPAYVATAGFDPLRDEGEAYARFLAENGVAAECQRFPTMIHGFFNIVGVGRECRAHAAEIADRLRAGLG